MPDQVITETTYRFTGEDGYDRCRAFINTKPDINFRLRSPESGIYDAVVTSEVVHLTT